MVLNVDLCINGGCLTAKKSYSLQFNLGQLAYRHPGWEGFGHCHHSCHTKGVFTLLTSRFLKSRHFDPTIYTCVKKSRSFSFTKLHDFLVGSAHVRSQATVHAFMHAVCMRGRGYTDGSTQGHVMKNRDISRLAFTLANFAWNFATFQKNRTPGLRFFWRCFESVYALLLGNLHRNVAIFLMSRS